MFPPLCLRLYHSFFQNIIYLLRYSSLFKDHFEWHLPEVFSDFFSYKKPKPKKKPQKTQTQTQNQNNNAFTLTRYFLLQYFITSQPPVRLHDAVLSILQRAGWLIYRRFYSLFSALSANTACQKQIPELV